ncbi:MAG: DUF4282 domain-containing protein [Spongiibacteraceae bacterium]|nr:DUF4282 domain-containing protein [Spongiibacteraceae bacterium]
MREMFFFNSMVTPRIITFVYWLLLFFSVIWGIGAMFMGWGGFTFGKFLMGLAIMVSGAIGARIWCELMIVLFKIHENLKLLAEKEA